MLQATENKGIQSATHYGRISDATQFASDLTARFGVEASREAICSLEHQAPMSSSKCD